MPIYEFMCPDCGHHFEKLVKLDESPACPSCLGEKPQRQFSMSAGIITGKSQKKAIGEARQRAQSVKKEQDHAQAEYQRNYIRDHSDHE